MQNSQVIGIDERRKNVVASQCSVKLRDRVFPDSTEEKYLLKASMIEKVWELLVVLCHSGDQSQITPWFTKAFWEMKHKKQCLEHWWMKSASCRFCLRTSLFTYADKLTSSVSTHCDSLPTLRHETCHYSRVKNATWLLLNMALKCQWSS